MRPIHEQKWKTRHTNIGPVIDDVSEHPEDEPICMVYAPGSYRGDGMTLVESDRIRDARARAIEALPDALAALLPLARFVEAWDAKPLRGIDDILYGIHDGEGLPGGADIRLSDLRKCLDALKKAGVAP